MNSETSKNAPKHYTLKPSYTPLPTTHSKKSSSLKHLEDNNRKLTSSDNGIRAANEDDDLYDPYSDYHDGTLREVEFEQDPWN